MRSHQRRLFSVYRSLSVHERVALLLQRATSDEPSDSDIQWSMPWADRPEYQRLVSLCAAANGAIADYGSLELAELEALELKLALCGAIQLIVDRERVDAMLTRGRPEPITATAHAQLRSAARAELLPLATIAELLAPIDDDPEVVLRKRKGVTDRLRRAIKDGTLAATEGAAGPLLEVGACYHLLGEDIPICNEWGLPYQVLPDTQAEAVDAARAYRRQLEDGLMRTPRLSDSRLTEDDSSYFAHQVLASDVDDDVHRRWRYLQPVLAVVDEVRDELRGEDPLLPAFRAELDEVETKLVSLHGQLAELLDGARELEDPSEEAVDAVRNLFLFDEC